MTREGDQGIVISDALLPVWTSFLASFELKGLSVV